VLDAFGRKVLVLLRSPGTSGEPLSFFCFVLGVSVFCFFAAEPGVAATVLGVLDVSPTATESPFLGVTGFLVFSLVFFGILNGLLGPDFADVVLVTAFLTIGVPAVVSLKLVRSRTPLLTG
jgi:hypothetical protein